MMPTGDNRSDVVRMVTGVEGTVRMRHQWVVRLDYGLIIPWVRRREIHGEEAITAVAGPDKLVLRGPRLPIGDEHRHVDEFDVTAGETLSFSMTWIPSYERTPPSADPPIAETIAADAEWAARCHDDVPHVDVVRRSLLTLRLMTHEQTGGIVAAPTTSLPEDFGGERNWDYRYCWLRDAALTIESLIDAGYIEEAGFWRHWLLRAVAGDPDDLQIMYAVDGSRHLPEHTLDHLPGYEGSRPVRIGNGAVEQKQTDVLGEVMVALSAARAAGLDSDEDSWNLQRSLVNRLAETWREPDHGLWEIRGPQRHFTHSRVMVWAAFDRAVRAVEVEGMEGPVDRWREARDEVCEELMTRGFDAERNTFTQHYDTREVDASLLVLPLVGFIKGDDPKMLGTIEAIEKDLMRDGPADALPHRDRRGRARRRRAPVPGLLVLAGLGVRRRRSPRRRERPLRPAGRAGQRRRPPVGGVRPAGAADGRQLPAGVQPPDARPGCVPAACSHRHRPLAPPAG